MERWTVNRAADLYGVDAWGSGYFSIGPGGQLLVRPRPDGSVAGVSLDAIVTGLKARGVDLPVLLRFSDILDSRIATLNESFRGAMAEAGYRGEYRGVYPIKVNQQQQVIEAITSFGRQYHHGLEAGSKAELIAAVAYLDDPEAYLICNGYKDREFVDLALHARRLGLNAVLVVEMPGELELILERGEALGVEPVIGVRMRPSVRTEGHWNGSSGDRSVFGLNAAQMMQMVDRLRAVDRLHCLKMLHYHLGSQLSNIRDVRRGVSEACRVYVGLVEEGAPMGLLDVGGGLAVDYDGSHTNFASSRNYSLQEYCADIVEAVASVCDATHTPHPVLVSESGRALVAHASVLLFDILDVTSFGSEPQAELPSPQTHELIASMLEVRETLNVKNAQECLHDLLYYRDEVRTRFEHGTVTLRQRATGETLFWTVLSEIADIVPEGRYVPEELRSLPSILTSIYYANFSVFQSLPDAWAIDQLFPVMPIHRLDEEPTCQGVLADITCDCDGRIDRFISLHDVRRSLPLHPLRESEDYILGVFLVGAYQETLGDLHNLLGDTNVVNLTWDEDGQISITHEIEGDSVADVLSYVEYDPKQLGDALRDRAERAVREKRLTPRERREILSAYRDGLQGYTYYES